MATTVSLKPNAVEISGSTSGTTTLQATAVAGTTTLTLPAATDTLVGKATTDTLTNKTLTTPSVSSPTISDGTANGVPYLNGSKVLTTGSALVFDGTNFSTTGTIKGSTTIGVGAATPSASGAGITFPATQSASSDANTLDDYEEGTFDLTAVPAGGGSITLNLKAMRYTKIGRMVYIQGFITVTSVSSPTGFVGFGNLPFAAAAGTESWAGALITDNLAGKSKAYIQASTSSITYSYYNDTNIAQDVTSAWSAVISLCYSV